MAKVSPPPNKTEEIQLIFTRLTELALAAEQPKKQGLTPFGGTNWVATFEPKIQGNRTIVKLEDFHPKADGPPRLAMDDKGAMVFAPELIGYRLTLGEKSYWIRERRDKERAVALVKQISPFLNGNRSEIESREWVDRLDELWDTDWKKIGANGKAYQEQVYPLLQTYAREFLSSGKKRVLEVGGGDGELAEKILDKHEENISDYYLLDLSEESCKKAKDRLPEKAHVHQRTITANYTDLVQPGSIDLVIGCGALTEGVLLDKFAAKAALEQICKVLKRGGVLLLSGKTRQWLNSKDLEKAGFSVKNKIIPSANPTLFPLSCYVAIYEPNLPAGPSSDKQDSDQEILSLWPRMVRRLTAVLGNGNSSGAMNPTAAAPVPQ
ncbi:MAG TPA: class I SAM-dependent methyltransferase, partial [Chlamydiales bacterium]|nr:class I SAM-dependent methyltransferase [Chlamydiales bacterium]